jgi:hypothetical protein
MGDTIKKLIFRVLSTHRNNSEFYRRPAAFILAVLILDIGGAVLTIPILTFFLLSRILLKIRKKHKSQFESICKQSKKHWPNSCQRWSVWISDSDGSLFPCFNDCNRSFDFYIRRLFPFLFSTFFLYCCDQLFSYQSCKWRVRSHSTNTGQQIDCKKRKPFLFQDIIV